MSESRFWLTFWGMIFIAIISVAGIVTTGLVIHTKYLVDAGYQQEVLPGVGYPVWVKIKDNHGN